MSTVSFGAPLEWDPNFNPRQADWSVVDPADMIASECFKLANRIGGNELTMKDMDIALVVHAKFKRLLKEKYSNPELDSAVSFSAHLVDKILVAAMVHLGELVDTSPNVAKETVRRHIEALRTLANAHELDDVIGKRAGLYYVSRILELQTTGHLEEHSWTDVR